MKGVNKANNPNVIPYGLPLPDDDEDPVPPIPVGPDVAVAERARINSKSESGDSAKEERDLEKEYTDQAKLNALSVFSYSLLLGIIAFSVGVVVSDGQFVGLGILLVLFGLFYSIQAHSFQCRIKKLIFLHNQILIIIDLYILQQILNIVWARISSKYIKLF